MCVYHPATPLLLGRVTARPLTGPAPFTTVSTHRPTLEPRDGGLVYGALRPCAASWAAVG